MSPARSVSRISGWLSTHRLLTLVPCVALAAGFAFLGALGRVPNGQVVPGVRAGGLDMGGKSLEDARASLEKWAAGRRQVTVVLRFPEETGITHVWKTQAERLGLGFDMRGTLEEIGKAGRESILGQAAHLVTGAQPTPVTPHIQVDSAKLNAFLKRIARRVAHRPVNAQLIPLGDDQFDTRPEKPGRALDMPASADAITRAWSAFNAASLEPPASSAPATPPAAQPANAPQSASTPPPAAGVSPPGSGARPASPPLGPLPVILVVKPVPAPVTAQDLKQIDGLLGSFSTHYGGTGISRGSNIALAASHINGTVLRPGEIFSYNQVVGPRSGSAGFRIAPVISHGELVPGVGGGVCQVSSTLYNAVLLADLKIVHRSHHAFPVHYLPAGRDATVVYGAIDFQFQNNTPAPIYIAGSGAHGRLSFHIYGKRVPGREVSIELNHHTVQAAPVEIERDPSLPAGRRIVEDKGHRGHRVTVYRVVRENGTVQRELISRDHYRTFPTVVRVGARSSAPKHKKAAASQTKPATTPGPAVTPPSPPSGPTNR